MESPPQVGVGSIPRESYLGSKKDFVLASMPTSISLLFYRVDSVTDKCLHEPGLVHFLNAEFDVSRIVSENENVKATARSKMIFQFACRLFVYGFIRPLRPLYLF
jgi:hypothetical protein